METGPLLPLQSLHTAIVRWNPGSPDTAVGFSYQGYGNPSLYVVARADVGIFPLCRKAAGYTFKRILRLHVKEAFHRYDKGGEVSALLKNKKITSSFSYSSLLSVDTSPMNFPVGEGVSVHDTHVMNTVCPSLPGVADQKVSLLLGILQHHRWIFER